MQSDLDLLENIFLSFYGLSCTKNSIHFRKLNWSLCNITIALKAMFYPSVTIQITATTITGRNVKHLSPKKMSHLIVFEYKNNCKFIPKEVAVQLPYNNK